MNIDVLKAVADYGVTTGLYIIIILGIIYYTPKVAKFIIDQFKDMINMFKDYIERIIDDNREHNEKLISKFEENTKYIIENNQKSLQQIIIVFEKYVNTSNDWHKKHDENLNEIKDLLNRK